MTHGGGAGGLPQAVRKVPTQVRGLDDILAGGVPESSLTLLSGGPGTGKTMLGMEFLIRGAIAGNPGIMLTFEEREDALRTYAAALGWDLRELEASGMLFVLSASIGPDAVLSGEFDLRGILGIISAKAEETGAERILIDAPDVFLRLMGDLPRERAELQGMHEWLIDSGLTSMMTVKSRRDHGVVPMYDFLDYMADCVIYLDQRVESQVTTRRLRVVKYRGSSYGRNEYPFSIRDTGIWIIPVTQASLGHRGLGESVSTGIEGLDEILGGGYRRSSCTLISGSSGTGKTTFACSFVDSVTSGGGKVLYLDFEESRDALLSSMTSPGIDLRPALDSGSLRFLSRMPESQGVEDHLIDAYSTIEEYGPSNVIVDAISACSRMGSEQAAFDYLLRLIDHCKERGITTLLTNLTTSRESEREITGIDLSSVIDTVILLRNREVEGAFRRELGILKSRGRRHSSLIHDFRITDDGIRIDSREVVDAH